MDDLIYSFLLQSDYPRASVIFDMDLLSPAKQAGAALNPPSFVIVDPHSAQILAVIEVVNAIDGDKLRQVAIETGAYASRLGGKVIQGFVIRVDVQGQTEAEQVQFYRIWPNSTLQQLSSKNFPDLESLKVARKLMDNESLPTTSANDDVTGPLYAKSTSEERSSSVVDNEIGPGAGLYVPALLLLALMLTEAYYLIAQDSSLFSVSQSVLAFGSAVLFTLPAAIRYLRQQS